MIQGLYKVPEVIEMIRQGRVLLLAGETSPLSQLPAGNWIAGTTPYFMVYPQQEIISSEHIFVQEMPDVKNIAIQLYNAQTIKNIYKDAPENGFTLVCMPFGSDVTVEFAMNAPSYEKFACGMVCGWVSGQLLEQLLTTTSYAAAGNVPELYSDKAVAMHITLPVDKYVELHIYNPFKQGKGDTITFDQSSMAIEHAMINGVKQNFPEYLIKNHIDLRLPMVANYSGAMMNVNCFEIKDGKVYVSAPVFEAVQYRFAELDNSPEPFLVNEQTLFSFGCVANFVHPYLREHCMKNLHGPITYGEIAYQLVNQTIMYATIGNVQNNSSVK